MWPVVRFANKPNLLRPNFGVITAIWEDISIDFVTGLPNVNGKAVIVMVVDSLTKYCHLGSLPASYSAVQVDFFFIREVVRLHGVPKTIVSDRDKVFLSHFWKELLNKSGITLQMSMAYHPQTNGQIEIVTKTVEQYLCAMVHDNPRSWVEFLPWAELWYNTSHHHSLGTTPFQVVYGRAPPKIMNYRLGNSPLEAVDVILQRRDTLLRELRTHLLVAQNRMKTYADQRRKAHEFQEGDRV